ncbi:MAG: HisA/HisF-related TIM barrel protein [Candidatus Bathyarchaeota archaeon]
MKIIPVIDILNGTVVHATKGRRKEYRPLKSILCTSPNPLDIALAFKFNFGFDHLYIADLDAIQGGKMNLKLMQKIKAETDCKIMLDCGINSLNSAKKVLESGVAEIFIGTETLDDLAFIKKAVKFLPQSQVTVSLDVIGGKSLSKSPLLSSMDPIFLAKILKGLGVIKIVFLDLTRVGTMSGSNLEILRKLLKISDMEISVGGGITSLSELRLLRSIGVLRAFVATAFHKGKITKAELTSSGLLQ